MERRISFDLWTIVFAAVLLVALLVRLWNLGGVPAALHPDEMAGLVGTLDEIAGRTPLRPFFDFRIVYLPLYGVSEYLATLIGGYSTFVYRMPAVIYGLATVITTTGLVARLTHDRRTGLVAGAIVAILPWDVVISRMAEEPAAMLPFLLGGLWALRYGLDEQRAAAIALAGALLGVGSYSYRAALPDGIALTAAMLVLQPRTALRAWRGVLAGAVIFIALVTPLAIAVARDPWFFWRDRHIETFAFGVNARTLAVFVRNYVAHFDFGPLFIHGDGNLLHGPNYGVLYLWMLPFILIGAIAAWRFCGTVRAAWLWVWLLVYPLGGALTNDGVPHFPRTLIGAPLAAAFCAIGLLAAWRLLGSVRARPYRLAAALVLGIALFVQFAQFCKAYFIQYVAPSAKAFGYENRALFVAIRALDPHRACFVGVNPLNALALFDFYLRDLHIQTIEGGTRACELPGSIVAIRKPTDAPPNATLIETIPRYDGTVAYYLYRTQAAPGMRP